MKIDTAAMPHSVAPLGVASIGSVGPSPTALTLRALLAMVRSVGYKGPAVMPRITIRP
jgi:hypothetical protein